MPTFEFFARIGVFCMEGFLESNRCRELRSIVNRSPDSQAMVMKIGAGCAVDEHMRKTRVVSNENALTTVMQRLAKLKPKLSAHFNLQLTDFETPQLLRYRTGDFYRPHRDVNPARDAPNYAQARKLSILLFLNEPSSADRPDGYCGGALTLYGLLGESQWRSYGFPLRGAAGLLIVFPAATVHEVTPVTSGERYTCVTWAY